MWTSWEEVRDEIGQLNHSLDDYQLDSSGEIRIFPFSRSPDSGPIARFISDDLPNVMPMIAQQFAANRLFFRKRLGMFSSVAKETAILDKLQTYLPTRITDKLTNLSIGRNYDVYQVADFVVKIERYYGETLFPSFRIWAHRWADMEDMLSPTQRAIYRHIKNNKNTRIAVFRSATTQEFYRTTIAKQLPVGAYAVTEFALLQIGDCLLDIQIQLLKRGLTLFSMLQRHNFLHRTLVGKPYYSLKPEFTSLKAILKGELGKFLNLARIDLNPDNFVFEDKAKRLVLVDIQEFSPIYYDHNKEILQAIWESW